MLFLAHGQAADGKSIKGQFHQPGGAFFSQMRIQRPLNNGEHRLRGVLPGRKAADRPALRHLQGRTSCLLIRRARDALIQYHHDVATDRHLRLDAELRAQQDALPIDITLKYRPLFRHRPRVWQRKDLIPARVRQHCPRPLHEAMNAAHLPKHLRPRPQQQMIGVRQQDL